MKKHKKKYPLIAFRVKEHQYEYIRREATERGMSIAEYGRAILIPFDHSTVKQLLTK